MSSGGRCESLVLQYRSQALVKAGALLPRVHGATNPSCFPDVWRFLLLAPSRSACDLAEGRPSRRKYCHANGLRSCFRCVCGECHLVLCTITALPHHKGATLLATPTHNGFRFECHRRTYLHIYIYISSKARGGIQNVRVAFRPYARIRTTTYVGWAACLTPTRTTGTFFPQLRTTRHAAKGR